MSGGALFDFSEFKNHATDDRIREYAESAEAENFIRVWKGNGCK